MVELDYYAESDSGQTSLLGKVVRLGVGGFVSFHNAPVGFCLISQALRGRKDIDFNSMKVPFLLGLGFLGATALYTSSHTRFEDELISFEREVGGEHWARVKIQNYDELDFGSFASKIQERGLLETTILANHVLYDYMTTFKDYFTHVGISISDLSGETVAECNYVNYKDPNDLVAYRRFPVEMSSQISSNSNLVQKYEYACDTVLIDFITFPQNYLR